MGIDPRILNRPIESEKIKTDLPCQRCGFNLRGLAVWTRCPECSLPISETMGDTPLPAPPEQKPDDESIPNLSTGSPFPTTDPLRPRPLLHFDNLPRATKARLGLAMTLVATGSTVLGGAMLLAWMLLFARGQSWLSADLHTIETVTGILACLIALPGALLWIAGQWMLTPLVPRKPTTKTEALATAARLDGIMVQKKPSWPWLVRLAPFPWVAVLLCVGVSAMGEGVESSVGTSVMYVGLALTFIAGLTHAFTCIHLREVALVMCDDLAARRFWESMLIIPLIILVTVAMLSPADLFNSTIGINTAVTHGLFGVLALIAFLMVAVWPVWRFYVGAWSLASACRGSLTDDVRKAGKERDKREQVRRAFERADARRQAGEEV